MEIVVKDLSSLERGARELLAALPADARILAFDAPMGAGKTTLIGALCRLLGVDAAEISSPTFAIVNHYTAHGGDVYHFDLYRLEDTAQAIEDGLQELLYSGEWCMVEWPGNCPGLLPDDAVRITISVAPDGARVISF